MTPSPQQLLIYSRLSRPGHFAIRACAGSGKTTTLVGLAGHLPRHERTIAIAFGREAADSLAAKMPFYVSCDTHHSFGLAACRRAWGKCRPDGNKCKYFLKDLLPDWKDRRDVQDVVLRLVGYAKNNAYGCEHAVRDRTRPFLEELADYYALDVTPQVLNLADRLLEMSSDRHDIVDFDDMLWLPLKHNLCFDKANTILLDEAQDTNVVQAALLPRMLADNGRLIVVGDPNQAIYGFRGAAHGAMEKLEQEFNMDVLPLSVSYRCSRAVVAEAQRVLAKPLRATPRFRETTITDEFDELEKFHEERERYEDTIL